MTFTINNDDIINNKEKIIETNTTTKDNNKEKTRIPLKRLKIKRGRIRQQNYKKTSFDILNEESNEINSSQSNENCLKKIILNISRDPSIFELLEFHLKRKNEINILSCKFNIIFFGYGEKKKLINELFPDILSINCNKKFDLDLFKEVYESITNMEIQKTIQRHKLKERKNELKKICTSRLKYKILLFNPSISFLNLIKGIENLSILVCHDNIDFKYTKRRFYQNKFTLFDLSTFIPYEDINDEIESFDKNIAFDILKILSNVPKKTVNIFKEILYLSIKSKFKVTGFIIKSVPFLEVIKEKYLIMDINIINQYLIEFFEHKILNRVDEGFKCNFTYQNAKEVLNELK